MPIFQGNIDKSKELHNLGKIHSFFISSGTIKIRVTGSAKVVLRSLASFSLLLLLFLHHFFSYYVLIIGREIDYKTLHIFC